jgi:SAM-dependent methyltransferase
MTDDDADPGGVPTGSVETARRRQRARDHLVPAWLDRLGVEAGASVVDVGCGPGLTAVRCAERVGPGGAVYALDRDPTVLAVLAREAELAGVIHPVVTDAAAPGVRFDRPVRALLALVLHHADRPAQVVGALVEALAAGSRLLVVEYDPDAAGEVGPSLDRRIAPDRLVAWLDAAGVAVDGPRSLEGECYGVSGRVSESSDRRVGTD